VERGCRHADDLDEGLRRFPDQAFDVVVLEETLQTLANPREMLAENVARGPAGMVSFPNFSHWRVLVDLVASGRMPVTEMVPYQCTRQPTSTPSPCGLLDWSRESGVRVVAATPTRMGRSARSAWTNNLHAEEVLIVVRTLILLVAVLAHRRAVRSASLLLLPLHRVRLPPTPPTRLTPDAV